MSKLTAQQLKEKYDKLPEDVKGAMFSVDTSEVIRAIGEENKLMIDKTGQLADEVGLVMLGITSTKEFIPNLARRLGVDRDTARKIAEDVNSQIFAKVRESLRKVHEVGEEEEEGEIEVTSPSPSLVRRGEDKSPEKDSAGEVSKEELVKEIETEPGDVSGVEILPAPEITPALPESKKELMDEIEEEELKTLFEAKTEEIVRMPKEESVHEEPARKEVEKTGYDSGQDPYRESLE